MNDILLIIVLNVSSCSLIAAVAALIVSACKAKALGRAQEKLLDDQEKLLDDQEKIKEKAALLPAMFQRFDSMSEEQRNSEQRSSERFGEFSRESLKTQLESQRSISKQLQELLEKNSDNSRRNAEILRVELDKIRGTVDEKLSETLTKRLDASFLTVSQQLENVYRSLGEMKELSVSVTDNVSGLNRILSNVKARGTWGETQLKSILDDIVPTLYETNVATNPDSQKRVEFAVRMHTASNTVVYLPIDSKFPIEDYARLCKAMDEGDMASMQEARKALKARLVTEARDVSEYIHEPETAPFAVLYLATEGLYAEMTSDENLTAKIRSESRVLLCGPSTVAALLNSLAMGMRTVEINRKAEEIRSLLAEVRDQYGKFSDQLKKVRKKLNEAENALDDAEKRNRVINKRLGRAELGENNGSNALGLEDIDGAAGAEVFDDASGSEYGDGE
jgi:DNA recombination protein RmuC